MTKIGYSQLLLYPAGTTTEWFHAHVQDEIIGDLRFLEGQVEDQGALPVESAFIQFRIPADVQEVQLGGLPGAWHLMNTKNPSMRWPEFAALKVLPTTEGEGLLVTYEYLENGRRTLVANVVDMDNNILAALLRWELPVRQRSLTLGVNGNPRLDCTWFLSNPKQRLSWNAVSS